MSEDKSSDSDGEKKQTLNRYSAPEGNDFAVGNSGGGAPKGNTNALTHGTTADPMNLVGELEDNERELLDGLTAAYLERAPFTADDPLYERLQITCIKAVQERRGEREILRDGPTVEKVVSVSDDGTEHTEKEEHYLRKFTSSLSRDIRQNLKELNCLPGSASSGEGETVAAVFEAAVDRAKEKEEPDTVDV